MTLLSTGKALGAEICDVLGLKHCYCLDFHIDTNSIVRVTAGINIEKDQGNRIAKILQKYTLIKIGEEVVPGKAINGVEEKTCIGDEIASYAYAMPVADLMKNATCEIELTGIKTMRARSFFGILLFKFAAWVTGMKGRIKVGDTVMEEIV